MKKLVLASVSALALLSVAACSDSTDTTQTQSVPETQTTEPAPIPAEPATPPATDNTTTQSVDPTPDTGTGDESQMKPVGKRSIDEESRSSTGFFHASAPRRYRERRHRALESAARRFAATASLAKYRVSP